MLFKQNDVKRINVSRKKPKKLLKEIRLEDINNLSNEEFVALMTGLQKDHADKMTDLGDPNYESYTIGEKINFWETSLNRQMRRQAEAGLNEYAIFSFDWYRAIKKLEPQFDYIMDQVFMRFSFSEWKKEEYLKRIKKR